MSLLPSSLSVKVDMKRRACVLDTYLALSTYGLLLSQRLSSELDLWLVRELWQILDNTEFHLSQPRSLEPHWPGAVQVSGNRLKGVLQQWDLARTETDLAGLNVYWIGDALRESLLPPGVDPQLVRRFETLARSLDRRAQSAGQIHGHDLAAACFRDAAALSVALTPYRSFILTHVWPEDPRSPESEPLLCTYLRQWGIRCFRVGSTRKTEFEMEFIRPILARTGVSELMWAGLNLAAVHLLVPNAVVIPDIEKEAPSFADELPVSEEDETVDWWEDAIGFWYAMGYD